VKRGLLLFLPLLEGGSPAGRAPAGRVPGRQFHFFGEESVLAAGPFGLFLDVQFYSTIGVFGVFGFGFGPCLDV